MALINTKKNFIFFHLYKCGGMSLRKSLQKNVKGSKELLGGHCLPRDLKHHYDVRGEKFQQIYNDMFKFTIIRNPFAFLLSTYYYAKTYKNHFWHKQVNNMNFKDFPAFYLKYIEIHKDPKIRPHGSNKVTSIYEWVRDEKGNVIVDFVGKLENIDKDMNYIMEKIGEPPLKIMKTNVNVNNNKPYQQVYDAKTRTFVEKHFAKDLEYFNYVF